MNSVAKAERNMVQVKEKFKTLKSEVKKKTSEIIRERKKTGGGEAKEITL